MTKLRKISGAMAATLLLGAAVAVAAPLSAQAAEAPAASTSSTAQGVTVYGPYDSEGTCNYIRATYPGKKSECFHNGVDGWYFTAPK